MFFHKKSSDFENILVVLELHVNMYGKMAKLRFYEKRYIFETKQKC